MYETQIDHDVAQQELSTWAQWVAWEYGAPRGENQKPPKVPIHPREFYEARVNDPSSWGTYDEAKNSPLDGIGFVLTPDDPYTFIDLDNCIDLDTGEVAPWADAIVQEIDTGLSL